MNIEYNIQVPEKTRRGGREKTHTLLAFMDFMDSDNRTMRMTFNTVKESHNAYRIIAGYLGRHVQQKGKYGIRICDKNCYVWKKEENA